MPCAAAAGRSRSSCDPSRSPRSKTGTADAAPAGPDFPSFFTSLTHSDRRPLYFSFRPRKKRPCVSIQCFERKKSGICTKASWRAHIVSPFCLGFSFFLKQKSTAKKEARCALGRVCASVDGHTTGPHSPSKIKKRKQEKSACLLCRVVPNAPGGAALTRPQWAGALCQKRHMSRAGPVFWRRLRAPPQNKRTKNPCCPRTTAGTEDVPSPLPKKKEKRTRRLAPFLGAAAHNHRKKAGRRCACVPCGLFCLN